MVIAFAPFDREIADQPEESKNADRKAFLLQFVTSGMYWHLFTDDDQHVLESLRDNRWREAHLLRFLEHVDYVHYVLDNWLRTNVPYPLTWGLRTALDYIPAFAADLPDIAPTLWPAAMQRFAEQWVSEHADVPEEDDVFNEIQRLNSVTEG